MKKIITMTICTIVIMLTMNGCGNSVNNGSNNDNSNYTYKYDIFVNGKRINSEVIRSDGSTRNYIAYVSQATDATDIELTFVIHEKPVRESAVDADKLLKENFQVDTLYNEFTSSDAKTEKVKHDGEEWTKYSITYMFDDIKQVDMISVSFGPNVVKNLNLKQDYFNIKFLV